MDKGNALSLLTEIHNEKVMELEKEIVDRQRSLFESDEKIGDLHFDVAELKEENERYREIIQDILNHADRFKMPKLEQVMLRQALESFGSQSLEGDPNESS